MTNGTTAAQAPPSTALAQPRELTAFQRAMQPFAQALKGRRDNYASVLPKHVNVDRFMRSALIALQKNTDLLSCSEESFAKSMFEAATLGLDVSGILGSAYLVPFKKTCTLIPGYRGLIGLARQSGEVEIVMAFVRYPKDLFTIEYGTEPKITHVPNFDQPLEPAHVIGAYAIAKIRGGERQFVYKTRAEIEAIRTKSPSGGGAGTPWGPYWIPMAKKTVIRDLIKFLPLSVEKLARALELDDAYDKGQQAPPGVIDVDAFVAEAKEPLEEPKPDTTEADAAERAKLIERLIKAKIEKPDLVDKALATISLPAGAKVESLELGQIRQVAAAFDSFSKKPGGAS